MRHILKDVQVNMPYRMLIDEYLPLITQKRINPEIGFDCFALDSFKKADFMDMASRLSDAGLSITFHAPFFDLRPGALDRKIRDVTIQRLNQVFELVPYFKPKTVVCHASYDERYYVSNEDEWLENSRKTWKEFVVMAEQMDTVIALENVYENNPAYLVQLLNSFRESSRICFCFDTGHFNAFSDTPLELWMDEMEPHIGQIHLHDNNGHKDEHVAVGDGSFPFGDFFERLKKKRNRPIITLEPHTEDTLWRTLENIESLRLFDHLA
jgi:sugar phosphate isomerase/epimerase